MWEEKQRWASAHGLNSRRARVASSGGLSDCPHSRRGSLTALQLLLILHLAEEINVDRFAAHVRAAPKPATVGTAEASKLLMAPKSQEVRALLAGGTRETLARKEIVRGSAIAFRLRIGSTKHSRGQELVVEILRRLQYDTNMFVHSSKMISSLHDTYSNSEASPNRRRAILQSKRPIDGL